MLKNSPKKKMEDFKKFAESYWQNINVDELKPIFHNGVPMTEEEFKRRSKELERVEEMTKRYNKEHHIESSDPPILFPQLEVHYQMPQ